MDDTQKLLKTIINHQSSVKEELMKEIRSVRTKVDVLGDELNDFKKETKDSFRKVNERIDELKEKVEKISKKFALA